VSSFFTFYILSGKLGVGNGAQHMHSKAVFLNECGSAGRQIQAPVRALIGQIQYVVAQVDATVCGKMREAFRLSSGRPKKSPCLQEKARGL